MISTPFCFDGFQASSATMALRAAALKSPGAHAAPLPLSSSTSFSHPFSRVQPMMTADTASTFLQLWPAAVTVACHAPHPTGISRHCTATACIRFGTCPRPTTCSSSDGTIAGSERLGGQSTARASRRHGERRQQHALHIHLKLNNRVVGRASLAGAHCHGQGQRHPWRQVRQPTAHPTHCCRLAVPCAM